MTGVLRGIASRKKRPWLLAAVGLILIVAAWKTKLGAPRPEPDTIAYHYEQWLHHKQNLVWGIETNRLGIKKAIWYLDGQPSRKDRSEEIRRHEDFLLHSGFFEYRDFAVKGVGLREFIIAFDQRAKQARLVSSKAFMLAEDQQEVRRVHFTARKEDMLAIEAIIKNITSASTNR